MNKIISINEDLITSGSNKIEILWMITDFCNFSCSYCIATERFLGKKVGDNEIKLFLSSIKKIILQKPKIEIKIFLSGGEPTLNSKIFNIISHLQEIDNIKIIEIITNTSILSNFGNKIKEKGSIKKLRFSCSFHSSQITKEKFVKNLKIIKELKIPFEVNFLIPYDKEICEIEYLINYIKIEGKIENLKTELIIESNKTSQKYSSEIINYYKTNKKEDSKLNFRLYNDGLIMKSTNGMKKLLNLESFIYYAENRKYKGWLCYNYINNYHIVRPDGVLIYGGCDIFRNTNLEMNFYKDFKIINNPVICTKEICRCEGNINVPKIYNKHYSDYYLKVDKLLLLTKNIINKKNNGELIIDKIRLINNGISENIIKVNFIFKNIENKYLITTIGNSGDINIGDFFITIKRNDLSKDLTPFLKELFYLEKNIISIIVNKFKNILKSN